LFAIPDSVETNHDPGLWPGPRYEVRVRISAPLRFVYKWCTDYDSSDGTLSGEGYVRRVLSRESRSVVLEDLYDTKKGWVWIRRDIRLFPPNRWHADSIGSDRALSVEYSLSSLPGNNTELRIEAQRRPYGVGKKNPPKSEWERTVSTSWSKFAKELESGFERSRRARRSQ
jgi:hypothetical protein